MTIAKCIQRHDQAHQNLLQILDTLISVECPKDDSEELDVSHINLPEIIQKASQELLSLKANHRSACLLLEQTMDRVRNEKSKVDAGRVILHNLTYQKQHLEKEIAHCKDYNTPCLNEMIQTIGGTTSDYQNDTTDTTKEDRFLDPHQHEANLQILNFQIDERARLVQELESSQSKLAAMQKETKEKHTFVSDLLRKVEQIEIATFPLQQYFVHGFSSSSNHALLSSSSSSSTPSFQALAQMNNYNNSSNNNSHIVSEGALSHQRKRYQRASQLPTPLYTLCCQLEALADTLQHQTEQQQKQQQQQSLNNNDEALLSQISIHVDVATSKPILSSTSSSSIEEGNDMSQDQTCFYETDPSAVLLTFTHADFTSLSDSSSLTTTTTTTSSVSSSLKKTTLRFQYLTQLNIITAVVEEEDASNIHNINHHNKDLLFQIFPGDNGMETPNASNYHTTCNTSSGDGDGDSNPYFSGLPSNNIMPARPYLWAQWLAGLSFLPHAPSLMQSNHDNNHVNNDNLQPSSKKQKMQNVQSKVEPRTVATIVRQLKRRIYSHSILEQLLSKLSKAPYPCFPHLDYSNIVNTMSKSEFNPKKDLIRLKSWKPCSMEKQVEWIHLFPTELEDNHDDNDDDVESGYSLGRNVNRYFMAHLSSTSTSNASSTALEAIVEISPEYPIRAPRWRLYRPQSQPTQQQQSSSSSYTSNTILQDNNLKAIEHRVNVDYESELVDPNNKEETYAWLLVHQLRMIMACWEVSVYESIMADASASGGSNNNSNNNNHNNNTNSASRLRRGRDRRSRKAFEDYVM